MYKENIKKYKKILNRIKKFQNKYIYWNNGKPGIITPYTDECKEDFLEIRHLCELVVRKTLGEKSPYYLETERLLKEKYFPHYSVIHHLSIITKKAYKMYRKIAKEFEGDKNEKVDTVSKKMIVSKDVKLKCGNLILDPSNATLKYKKNPPVEIQPDNIVIRFLKLLLINKNTVLKYSQIARDLNLNCYSVNPTKEYDANIARNVQFIKRDLKKILKKVGLTQKEIDQMILSKKNVGYKLPCKD